MAKVLVLDPVHAAGLEILDAAPGVDCVHLPEPTEPDIAEQLADAEVLILRGRRLPRALFAQAAKLRLVSRHGVGCDNLDFDLLQEMGVTVAVSADSNYLSVAEHAFALTLAGLKQLPAGDQAVRSSEWGRRENLGTRELNGATVLVVGYGRIGRAFATRVQAFGADCLIFDPVLSDDRALAPGQVRVVTLEAGLAAADVVSLHVPSSPETHNLLNAARLECMRDGAILVNTARGGIVDETALLDGLDRGRPALYATDVLASEPPAPDDPLLQRSDVILTPHSAALTTESARRMSERAAQNAVDFLSGDLAAEMTAFRPS